MTLRLRGLTQSTPHHPALHHDAAPRRAEPQNSSPWGWGGAALQRRGLGRGRRAPRGCWDGLPLPAEGQLDALTWTTAAECPCGTQQPCLAPTRSRSDFR